MSPVCKMDMSWHVLFFPINTEKRNSIRFLWYSVYSFLFCILSQKLSVHLPPYKPETGHLHDDRNDPGCRIGNKQYFQWSVNREDSEDPHNSKADRSDNRQDHRHTGASHSTQCSRDQIHDPTQKIRDRSIKKNFHATGNYCLVRGINM